MPITNHFYHKITRKYIALFGSMFNKMSIIRTNETTGNEVQKLIVPINYGPYQKFLARIQQDENLNKKPAIVLPRMSYEILDIQYDGQRKVNSLYKMKNATNINNSVDFMYTGAPYNINFNLYIIAKYADDGTQLLEQIIPFFKPEVTTTVTLIEGLDSFDVPLILNGISLEDVYEGNFEERRSLLWVLNFSMKAWYFGPTRNKKVIKFVDVKTFNSSLNVSNTETSQVTVQPGLTISNTATTDINETIPYSQIDFDDDWGIITIITENI